MTQQAAIQPLHVDDRKIPSMLLWLALPIIASTVSRTMMNMIDFIMVTQLGTQAQAAILPASMILFCVSVATIGVFSAVTTYVAQSYGRNRKQDCAAYAWQGIYIGVASGILLLPTYWLVPVVFRWAGHEPVVQQMENIYAQIGILGLIPLLVASALGNFYTGIHRPIIPFVAGFLGIIFNIFGNYALIFGHWGFPALGIAGAAWSTQIAGLLQALIMLGWMLIPWYRREFHTLAAWRPNLSLIMKLLKLGAPAGIQFGVDAFSFTIFAIALVGQFGTVQLAANNIAFKLLEVSFMPTLGLGAAVTSAVGKAIGAGRPDRARRITNWGTLFGMSYMGFIAICYVVIYCLVAFFGPSPFHSWLTEDNNVIIWTTRLLLFCAVFQLFDALNIIHISALRGAGDNKVPAIVCGTLSMTLFLPGGFLLAHYVPQWQVGGPWFAATVYICLIGSYFWARWHFGPWEKIKLHDDPIEKSSVIPEAIPTH